MTAAVLAFALSSNQSNFSMPTIFGDHMVLQRNMPVQIFGRDGVGQKVVVRVAGKSTSAIAGRDGTWKAVLPKMGAGGPYKLEVSGSGSKTFKDIYFGEVWVCSGQSNMEFVVDQARNPELEKQESDTHIRMFTVTKNAQGLSPAPDVQGAWEVASPSVAGHFSAVGFSFAKTLFRDLKVPIGMIHTSWGGTPAEAWTRAVTLNSDPMTKPLADRAATIVGDYAHQYEPYLKQLGEWQEKHLDFKTPDTSNAGINIDDSNWERIPVPAPWAENVEGIAWVRTSVDLTAREASEITSIKLGQIDDLDISYINGVEVGRTDLSVANFYNTPRDYKFPTGILKEGTNVIAVRVVNLGGPGGIFAGTVQLGNHNLAGNWKFKLDSRFSTSPFTMPDFPREPMNPSNPNFPGSLMNGMIAPLVPYTIKGAIWYQGEANADRARQYTKLFPMMITDWRNLWNQGEFPFIFVQLANFMKNDPNQFDSAWAELRDAQTQTLSLKNTGMATILDIGEANDIHPKNKRDVGKRLAWNALARFYNRSIEYTGPTFSKVDFQGNQATVTFTHAAGMRTVDGKMARCFAVRSNSKWSWAASATIIKNTVVLTGPTGQTIDAVRYGYQDNPDVNLVNSVGLPANPFRTDREVWLTEINR